MKREITITYHWACEALQSDIPFVLSEVLEGHTYDRVFQMLKEGFTSGELCCDALVEIDGKETPEDGWECRGWWEKREICL